MRVLVPVKRVVDYNVKVRVKADQSGVDLDSAVCERAEIALESLRGGGDRIDQGKVAVATSPQRSLYEASAGLHYR